MGMAEIHGDPCTGTVRCLDVMEIKKPDPARNFWNQDDAR